MTFESRLNGKGAADGQKWGGKVTYIPDDDQSYIFRIAPGKTDGDKTDGDKTDGDKTGGDKTDCDKTDCDKTDGDYTERVKTYNDLKAKCNLLEKVEEIWLCKSPLFKVQKTDFVFHHCFVVVKTSANYKKETTSSTAALCNNTKDNTENSECGKTFYYSFDKNEEGIYIQRSDKVEKVQNCIVGQDRNTVTKFIIKLDVKEKRKMSEKTLGDILKWIIGEDSLIHKSELKNTYNIFLFEQNCQGFSTKLFYKITNKEIKSTMFL